MKEKKESTKKNLREIKASNLSDIEFKVMVIRMLKESEISKELSGIYISMKTYIETLNKNNLEMKNAISEMKNTLEIINSRLDKQRIESASWKTE